MTFYRRVSAEQGKSIKALINLLDRLKVPHRVTRVAMSRPRGTLGSSYQLELHT